ncbi:uncharacterized protein EDB91DRAFT_1254307 [Suillus paluster]|uniref:uncharacterized protein n=1 Tax=Suillus paluster TaxID=48578 RepID=UPI001B87F255|nr:uncharacterized protein EDB91DRAFT_1254307 [Suillus paluster]KAG1726545.1 hypothetical protein EDB91DRAFT_1254307 [Suillus paluster]
MDMDISTVLPVPFSPNAWKVRNAPIETTDIASECKSLEIPPTSALPDGTSKYTLPALIDNVTSPSCPFLPRALPSCQSRHSRLLWIPRRPVYHSAVACTEAAFGKKLELIELRGEEHWKKFEGASDLLASLMQAGRRVVLPELDASDGLSDLSQLTSPPSTPPHSPPHASPAPSLFSSSSNSSSDSPTPFRRA